MQRLLILVVLLLGLVASGRPFAEGALTAAQADRVPLANHVLPALAQAMPAVNPRVTGQAEENAPELSLTVVLRRSDPQGFEQYLRDVYDPGSAQFRKFLTPLEVADRFGPTAEDYATVSGYFSDQGFKVAERSANRLTLTLKGTRAMAEAALAAPIRDYTMAIPGKVQARAFYANAAPPSLPTTIAWRVDAVLGLSNLAQAERSSAKVAATFSDGVRAKPLDSLIKALACGVSLLDYFFNSTHTQQVCLNCSAQVIGSLANSISCGFPHIFAPPPPPPPPPPPDQPDVRTPNDGGGGSGVPTPSQDPNAPTVRANRIAPAAAASHQRLRTAVDRAHPQDSGNWLDVDGTGQKIGLLEFDTFVVADVAAYLDLMYLPSNLLSHLSQVHVNGGATLGANQAEVLLDIDFVLPTAPGANVVVYDAPFTGAGSFQSLLNRMISDGMTVISNSWSYCEDQTTLADAQSVDSVLAAAAASGIGVYNGSGDTGSTCLDGAPNTIGVPAGSPHATAVGGSTQIPNPQAPFLYGTETWWDGSTQVPPTGRGGYGTSRYYDRPTYQNGFTASAKRSIPDVVAAADPQNGIAICQATGGGCPTPYQYGGTSLAAPSWAAYAALLNQAQGSNLGLLNAQLYTLANTAGFHSPASLGSDFAHVGLGSPNVNALHVVLAGLTLGTASAANSHMAVVSGKVAADGSTPLSVVVVLNDANGNSLAGKTVTLSANAGSHAVIVPASAITSVANGAAVFSVTDATIEDIALTAHDVTDGVDVAAAGPVSFVSPPATSGGLVASLPTVPADGVTSSAITVTLHNAQSQGASGKVVRLSQGAGRSRISAPVPATTDSNGQVVFTVTNLFAESVSYIAVDATDDSLRVPGVATVAFTNGAGQQCNVAQALASAGFAVSGFATSFAYGVFGGCAGAAGIAFDPNGNLYVVDEADGNLYRFTSGGGAANSGTRITATPYPLSWCSVGLAFSKDGAHLFMARQFCGLGGDVVEISTVDGSVIRTVGSNMLCATGLATDPLSGDLFVSSPCPPGGGTANIYRIANPAGASPVVSVYSTPGHAQTLAFTPDGTLWATPYQYDVNRRDIVRIAGTNASTPGAVTILKSQVSGDPAFSGVAAIPTLNVASPANPTALAVMNSNGGINLLDLTQNPPAFTPMTTGGDAQITLAAGPDSCLYATDRDRIYRVTNADGSCAFSPSTPAPTLILTPSLATPNPVQGSQQTLTARFVNLAVPASTSVYFGIEGANTQLLAGRTDAAGTAIVTYTGVSAGIDVIHARAVVGTTNLISNAGQVSWIAGKHVSFISLNSGASSATAGNPLLLSATLVDASLTPNTAIAGATIQFSLGGQACSGVTNAIGAASCTVTPLAGQQTMIATFLGNVQFVAATASRQFDVLPAVTPPAVGLVYVPLEPCRIMDTRSATLASGVQGPLAGNVLYGIPGYINAGQNWSQFGGTSATDCGLTNPPGGSIHSVAVVVTILNPNFDAYLGISDVSSLGNVLSNVALNYTHGQGLSTMYFVPQVASNSIYFAMPAGLTAQLIFDVVGYHVVADATAIQCTSQVSAPVSITGSNGTGSATSPSCASGYALSSGSCDSSAMNMSLTQDKATNGNTAWFCSATNRGGVPANLTATATCCRVPGK